MVLINLQCYTDWNVLSKKDDNFSSGLLQMTSPRIKQNTFISPALCSDSQQMRHLFARHQHLRGREKKKKESILLLTFSSFAPQLDAAPKTEAGAEQRMELQREVEALKVNLEKQVGAASVRACVGGRARCCFCNESATQFQRRT